MPDPVTSWRLADGEEARLLPEGALITSRGTLPFRVRSEGERHLRAAFPGTAVRLGGDTYEVVGEEASADTVTYRLRPWPPDHVVRQAVTYDRRLILEVQRERRQAEERRRARLYGWALHPLVGFLPEGPQLQACDRWGLHPAIATFTSAALEMLAGFAIGRAFAAGKISALPLVFAFVFPAALRMVFALLFREVSGWWVLTLASRLDLGSSRRRRLDASVLPLTREAFWARLAQADRHEPEPEGTILVTSTLEHLTWTGSRRLQSASGDYWLAAALPVAMERGRLIYRYRLTPLGEAEPGRAPQPPGRRAYQDEVLEGVAREWDDVLLAGAVLATLLPGDVQQRAFGPRGGPAIAAGKAKITALGEIATGLWLIGSGLATHSLSGADVLSLAILAEGGLRFARASGGEYAPSVLGLVFADLLRPERVAYQAHLAAERERLRSAPA